MHHRRRETTATGSWGTASVIKGLCIRISVETLRQSWLTVGTSPFSRARAGGKTRRALNRYDSEAHYSLTVSLHVPETGVDLLTPVQLKVDELITSQIEIPF